VQTIHKMHRTGTRSRAFRRSGAHGVTPREKITSFQNPRIKQVRRLREKKGRIDDGLFVIDEPRDLSRALACGYTLQHVFYCPTLDPQRAAVDRLPAGTSIYEIERDLMEKIGYRENPSAIVAVMHSQPPKRAREFDGGAACVLGLVGLEKPGNIGALLRTADATGFDAVLLIDTALDLYNPNVIRSSTGACFLGNIYTLTSAEAIALLSQRGYTVYAAAVEGETSLYATTFTDRCAVILGTEDLGLDVTWLQAADARAQIPMVGKLSDSLNVSVSGAIFMAEVLRQRFKSGAIAGKTDRDLRANLQ
jgi:TrmH family RNA methyltransferase